MISKQQALQRLAQLLARIERLSGMTVVYDDREVYAEANAALVSAKSLAAHLLPNESPIRTALGQEEIFGMDEEGKYNRGMLLNVAEILRSIREEIEAGLLGSVAGGIQASIFDDFIDYAQAFLDAGRKNEAGAIAGVTFEDTIRRLCDKHNIQEKGQKLDALIISLAKSGAINDLEAKRSRVGAHVRTKATHAQWDEFDSSAVKETIEFLRNCLIVRLAS